MSPSCALFQSAPARMSGRHRDAVALGVKPRKFQSAPARMSDSKKDWLPEAASQEVSIRARSDERATLEQHPGGRL